MTRRIRGRLASLVAALALALVSAGCVTVSSTSSGESADGAGTVAPVALSSASPTGAAGDRAPAASGPTESTAVGSPGTASGPAIGYISLGEQWPFAQAVSQSVREEARRLGVDLIECDSRLEREGVRECAEQLGEAGVVGAISFGAFPDLGADICAALGGVPVVGVAYDQGPCQVSAVGTDNHAAGALAGDALGRFSQERWDCDINAWVSLEASAAGTLGAERMAGYRDGYERYCAIPDDAAIVLDGTDRVVTAQRRVAALLEDLRGGRILIVGLNEDAVTGALRAARSAGREKDVWVSGQGADPSARRSIACDEHYVASVAHLPERFGELLVPTLMAAVEGREVPSRVDTPIRLVAGPGDP